MNQPLRTARLFSKFGIIQAGTHKLNFAYDDDAAAAVSSRVVRLEGGGRGGGGRIYKACRCVSNGGSPVTR